MLTTDTRRIVGEKKLKTVCIHFNNSYFIFYTQNVRYAIASTLSRMHIIKINIPALAKKSTWRNYLVKTWYAAKKWLIFPRVMIVGYC